MEILLWILGVISSVLVLFLGWMGGAIVEIKKSVAVIEEKLSTGDKKHDDFDTRISKHDEQIAQLQTDIAVLKSKEKKL